MVPANHSNHHVLETSERVVGHTIAIFGGFALAVLGVALSVTMVLLPIGLPIGLAGVMLLIWGLCFAPKGKVM